MQGLSVWAALPQHVNHMGSGCLLSSWPQLVGWLLAFPHLPIKANTSTEPGYGYRTLEWCSQCVYIYTYAFLSIINIRCMHGFSLCVLVPSDLGRFPFIPNPSFQSAAPAQLLPNLAKNNWGQALRENKTSCGHPWPAYGCRVLFTCRKGWMLMHYLACASLYQVWKCWEEGKYEDPSLIEWLVVERRDFLWWWGPFLFFWDTPLSKVVAVHYTVLFHAPGFSFPLFPPLLTLPLSHSPSLSFPSLPSLSNLRSQTDLRGSGLQD